MRHKLPACVSACQPLPPQAGSLRHLKHQTWSIDAEAPWRLRNHTDRAVSLRIPFGVLEAKERMTPEEARAVREEMRSRYAVPWQEVGTLAAPPETPPPVAVAPPVVVNPPQKKQPPKAPQPKPQNGDIIIRPNKRDKW